MKTKTLSNYTIYCTKTQTKRAIELGVPIVPYVNVETSRTEPHFIVGDSKHWILYFQPTAEQMIGWIEGLGIIDEINVSKNWDDTDTYVWSFDFYDANYNAIGCGGSFNSRPEATIAAIDAALEYLTNDNKTNNIKL